MTLNAVSVGYAKYYSIVMRTTLYNTLHTIHVGALENHKSNNITKLLTEIKKVIEVMERTKLM